jgi:hypothetical protein
VDCSICTPELRTDPTLAELSRDDLEAQITEMAGQLNAATYRWLMLIAEFDRRQGWGDGRLQSCAARRGRNMMLMSDGCRGSHLARGGCGLRKPSPVLNRAQAHLTCENDAQRIVHPQPAVDNAGCSNSKFRR